MVRTCIAMACPAGAQRTTSDGYSMIPKSGDRFSEKIMLKQELERDAHSKKNHPALVTLSRSLLALIAAWFGLQCLPLLAQTFPSRAVHLIVPYAPGGTGAIVARLLSEKLALALGQNVVVENRPAASRAIGA